MQLGLFGHAVLSVDTIQELQNLRQHLERVILVSHQEEFYSPFMTGYAIDIVDNGASKVKLLEL